MTKPLSEFPLFYEEIGGRSARWMARIQVLRAAAKRVKNKSKRGSKK